ARTRYSTSTGRSGTAYRPSASVVALRLVPVAAFSIVTVTPGRWFPSSPVTTPEMVPVRGCAAAAPATVHRAASAIETIRIAARFIRMGKYTLANPANPANPANQRYTVLFMRLRSIDAHAAGEPLRLVVDGFPSPRGRTMLDKREWVRRNA